jgi:hypothetical protein
LSSIWRLGEYGLAFLAGEIFSPTRAGLRALSNEVLMLPVS